MLRTLLKLKRLDISFTIDDCRLVRWIPNSNLFIALFSWVLERQFIFVTPDICYGDWSPDTGLKLEKKFRICFRTSQKLNGSLSLVCGETSDYSAGGAVLVRRMMVLDRKESAWLDQLIVKYLRCYLVEIYYANSLAS